MQYIAGYIHQLLYPTAFIGVHKYIAVHIHFHIYNNAGIFMLYSDSK